jgi:hypothetical protein
MSYKRSFLGLVLVMMLWFAMPLSAAGSSPELNASLMHTIAKLDREPELAAMIQKEYGTREEELQWASERSIGWGEITVLAYIQATTGRTFAEMTQHEARQDFWAYAENAGMSCEKMVRSLEGFRKRAERERNSRIFDQLRASRRIHALPDLGSGFGLFQEALDFRHIDLPQPTKTHTVTGNLAKGDK